MSDWTRRQFCAASALTACCAGAGDAPPRRTGCTLSIGTYSMKGIPLEEAVALVARIGFDGIEIAAQSDFDGAPERLSVARRAEVRRGLDATGLRLTALMENITPSADERVQRAHRERLSKVAELACALADDPSHPPLIQTVLGGGGWDEKKNLFRDRLGDWINATRAHKVVLAIKPHRGGALSRPEEGVWLIRQLGDSPWLRLVYDYSHYIYRDMSLEDTVRVALPYTAHVAVKDAFELGARVAFALPGARGTVDYPRLLRLLFDGGYRGDVCCEVSSMLSTMNSYVPEEAARACYANMAFAFKKAGVPRLLKEGR